MKLFRNIKTGKLYVSFTDRKDNLIDFKGNIITYTCSPDNYEEVNTEPMKQDFLRLHIVEETFDINEICNKDWNLKDVLYVPVDGKDVAFRVEHITDDKVYFVAVDMVGKSNMKDINDFLDNYLKKIPESLVGNMCDIEHCVDGNIVRKSKLTLLSRKNVKNVFEIEYKCNGVDDITFDGLKTEAERCKNIDGESKWYWLDTPRDSKYNAEASYFWIVYTTGRTGYANVNQSGIGVVPCFSIRNNL